MAIGFGQSSAEKEELVLHFGYGSNMSEAYMRQYTPSLKYVMNAQLPNFEIQFRKYSNNMGGGISSIIEKPGGMVYGVMYYITKKEMGHSKGCFALSMQDAKTIIPLIKNENCIFGYATSYYSNIINKDKAIKYYDQIRIGEAVMELLEPDNQSQTNP